MAKSAQLRITRAGTVINTTSKKQEEAIIRALHTVEERIHKKFRVKLVWVGSWKLADIVADLRRHFPDIDFHYYFGTSSIRPDGGILSLVDTENHTYPILIAEKKNQGTNDRRAQEGLKKQAQGNAIERLGKNVIGLKTAMTSRGIFPFVCFGDGCDFAETSSILDRVVTIAQFGRLNVMHLHPQGPNGEFVRGSFFFREVPWTEAEMAEIMFNIANRSVLYYQSKHGEENFARTRSKRIRGQ